MDRLPPAIRLDEAADSFPEAGSAQGAAGLDDHQATAPRRHANTVSYVMPALRPNSPNNASVSPPAAASTGSRRRGFSLTGMRPRSDEGTLAPMGRRTSMASISTLRPQHNQQVADLLDAIDPEVQVMSTLTDVQNSLFVPNFRAIFERAPAVRIPGQPARDAPPEQVSDQDFRLASQPARTLPVRGPLLDARNAPQVTTQARPLPAGAEPPYERDEAGQPIRPAVSVVKRVSSETDGPASVAKEAGSEVSTGETMLEDAEKVADEPAIQGDYLLLPKDLINWDDWTEDEKKQLDDYVRHLRYSRKERLRRTWRGFCHYVSTPLGAFIVVYATLLTFWGAAWVLFIIGWISVGDRQDYFIEICDQILTALFCVVGIGLAPFRAYDTYHMWFIVKYHRKVLRLRKERGYPDLRDPNEIPVEESHNESKGFRPVRDVTLNATGEIVSKELPDGSIICTTSADLEAAHVLHHGVLTDAEYASFLYHQHKFGKSHTFYRPHASVTHRAFPVDLLVVVISLLDFHSCFQIALGSLTWSVSYHHDWKHKVTAVVLSISITINVAAGLVIAVGNKRTRKKEIIERLLRQAITEEALKRAGRHPEKHPLPLARTDSGHVALLPQPITKGSKQKRTATETSTTSYHTAAEPEALGRRSESSKSKATVS